MAMIRELESLIEDLRANVFVILDDEEQISSVSKELTLMSTEHVDPQGVAEMRKRLGYVRSVVMRRGSTVQNVDTLKEFLATSRVLSTSLQVLEQYMTSRMG